MEVFPGCDLPAGRAKRKFPVTSWSGSLPGGPQDVRQRLGGDYPLSVRWFIMNTRRVQCPSCSTLLELPPGWSNCHVNCGQCHFRFRLPRRIAVSEDVVMAWLNEEDIPLPQNLPENSDDRVLAPTSSAWRQPLQSESPAHKTE